MEEARKALAANIKTQRLAKGKSLKEMSGEAGISYTYLRELENPEYGKNPSMETLDKLAHYFDLEVSLLFV